jgi:hypothetical protein
LVGSHRVGYFPSLGAFVIMLPIAAKNRGPVVGQNTTFLCLLHLYIDATPSRSLPGMTVCVIRCLSEFGKVRARPTRFGKRRIEP